MTLACTSWVPGWTGVAASSRAPAAASWLDRTLLRLGGVAVLATVVAGGLVLAALAVLVLGLLIPVILVTAAVGFGSLWWRMRRARRTGAAIFVVPRR